MLISYDPGDLVASLQAADVPVITFGAAFDLDGTYDQIEAIGSAAGHHEEARRVNQSIEAGLEETFADAPDVPNGTTYFHEIDANLYTVTSATYFGQIYERFGLENIADPAGEEGAAYPQLSNEFVVAADPDLIFLADTLYGESAETIATRPGWDVLTAVREGHVYPLDSDIASRWGPRVVDFAKSISDALESYVTGG